MHFLALIPTEQALNDLKSSGIPLDVTTVIIPESLGRIAPKHPIIMDDYENTGELCQIIGQLHSKNPITWIISPEEVDILRAAQLRSFLGIRGQSLDSALAFRKKTLMKDILKDARIPMHPYRATPTCLDLLSFLSEENFPVVIKPNLGTGSEGLTILRSQEDLDTLIKSGIYNLDKPSDLQAEKFIQGTMYNINGVWGDGDLICVWPSVYPKQSIEMLSGNPASSYTLSKENPLVPKLNDYAHRVLKALPTPPYSPFHLEVFVTSSGELFFCEIACRIGGKGVRQAWQTTFGVSLSSLYYQGILSQLGMADFPRPMGDLTPKILSGEIWFPSCPGKIITLEKHCPFPWVKDYHTFYEEGDIIKTKNETINDCLSGATLLLAGTEQEMTHNLDQLTQWVHETTLIQDEMINPRKLSQKKRLTE